ncbi:S8 family serine peptidase [Chloroflexia bacterium SDU3-3]|nr:S8 family serine peptidase [Chloroflexia bacterium SDU3-3]
MHLSLFCLCALICAAATPAAAAPAPPPDIRPGAVLVRLRPGASAAGVARLLPPDAALDAALAQDMLSVQVPVGGERAYAARMAALPGVAVAQPDHRLAAQALPDDPLLASQWAIGQIHAAEAWDVVTSTLDVPIAVLDTGAQLDHPDLAGQLWQNPGEAAGNGLDDDGNGLIDDTSGWHFYHVVSNFQSYARDDADLADPDGHGTHVAGIIAARGDNGQGTSGLAWRARLMVLRVLDADRSGWESDVIRGLGYAVEHGARVVNMSLGFDAPSPLLADAVAQAEARGVVVVAAAGNSGAVLYPAAYPSVLSVGASDAAGLRASFSASGPRLDLLAPGQGILSTWRDGGFYAMSGTSMAAPHVAGVAALVLERYPQTTPAQLRGCLLRSAQGVGAAGRDDDTGWGIVDAGAALRTCGGQVFLPLLGR